MSEKRIEAATAWARDNYWQLFEAARLPRTKAEKGLATLLAAFTESVEGWVSVSDRLPDVSGVYLAYDPTRVFRLPEVVVFDEGKWLTRGQELTGVTRWASIPEYKERGE